MIEAPIYYGLDLGTVKDPSALAGVRTWRGRYALTWLQSWHPARRDCLDALDVVLERVRREQGRCVVGIDGRGAYRDVAEAAVHGALGEEADVYPLLPSDSDRPPRTNADGWTWIGKTPTVEALRAAVATRHLVVGAGLEAGPEFVAQLKALVLVPSRRGRMVTWSHPPGGHDDLVQAAAYAYVLAVTLTTQGQIDAIRPARGRGC